MKILFGKHFGKDICELDSGYLIWIIESYDGADHTLIQACKAELSARLKLDWQPEDPQLPKLQSEIKSLSDKIDLLERLLLVSIICKGNRIEIDGYLANPEMMESDFKLIQQIQLT